MRNLLITFLFLIGYDAFAQSASDMHRQLELHGRKLPAWTQEKVLVAALKRQNAQRLTMAEIKKRDDAWIARKNAGLVQGVTTGACADLLRKLTVAGGYGEAFVTDGQGALVCASHLTSDYWQGDEPKWTESFAKGRGAVYADRLKHDDSSQSRIAHISVPVMEEGRAIGVLTVGVPVALLRKR